MQVEWATQPSPGQRNEDLVVTGPSWVAVLDGATAPPGVDSGCVHDVPWLVTHLGGELARTLTIDPGIGLPDALAGAIGATCDAHRGTCDLRNPSSPSSTAVVLRHAGDRVDYLVLADSPLIVDDGTHVTAIVDDRTAHLPDYTYAGVAQARNSPGGFWVASTHPEAAYEAVAGSMPASDVARAALLTDGAARLVERFGTLTWLQLLDLLTADGPDALIAATREAEQAETDEDRRQYARRGKHFDDATAALVTNIGARARRPARAAAGRVD